MLNQSLCDAMNYYTEGKKHGTVATSTSSDSVGQENVEISDNSDTGKAKESGKKSKPIKPKSQSQKPLTHHELELNINWQNNAEGQEAQKSTTDEAYNEESEQDNKDGDVLKGKIGQKQLITRE